MTGARGPEVARAVGTLLAAVLLWPGAAWAQCPQGFFLYQETKDKWTCALKPEAAALQREICKVTAEIDEARGKIEDYRRRLPGYFEALAEWRARSDEAVRKAVSESFGLLLGGLLAGGGQHAEEAARLTREEARTLQEIWVKQVVANPSVAQVTGDEMAKVLALSRRWESTHDIYQAVSALQAAIRLDDLRQEDAALVEKSVKGALEMLELLSSAPSLASRLASGAKALKPVALADYAINYVFAATAYGHSWARITQLRDTRLHEEATALQELFERKHQAREKLVAQRAALVTPGIQLPCPKKVGTGP